MTPERAQEIYLAHARSSHLRPAEERIKDLLKVLGQEDRCRGCGRKIWWLAPKNGKRVPYTEEGINHFQHFEDCEKANKFR